MRLFFDEITGKTDRYSITDSHWFPSTEECAAVAAIATISVSRQDRETVILQGEMNGRCKVVCDRCGEQYEENIRSEFIYLVTIGKEDDFESVEQECSDENALTLYLAEPVIDVEDILREQALLAVPLKKLCSEDCRGLCAGCGVVLNSEPCRCQPDHSTSPFAVLRKMRTR
jgi:uncharacterized protein